MTAAVVSGRQRAATSDSGRPGTNVIARAGRGGRTVSADRFVTRDNETFAGSHLLLDFWGAERLDDFDHIERALRRSVEVAGATLVHLHLHRFAPSGGVSGVALLAESHISIHTWPERGYAAVDIFMCGDAEPERAIAVLERAFNAERTETEELRRGKVR